MHIPGLHHVTAIASDPQRNLDFHTGVLGLRLVKRTVNFDDPGSYHFYFGDAAGSPGTILTFFSWPHARRGSRGSGGTEAPAFAIPSTSLDYWTARLKTHHVNIEPPIERFEETVLRFSDPDGMLFELVASPGATPGNAWAGGPVPTEHAIRGFHGITLLPESIEPTARLLSETFGYHQTGASGNRTRFTATGSTTPGAIVDLVEPASSIAPERSGAGIVHHVAFRVPDEDHQLAIREQLVRLRFAVSPVMDRTYFRSIYFREAGGILFEIATDGPGFTADESLEELGNHLRLPTWLETSRARIGAILPALQSPPRKAT